jgi:hypothetical protein
MNGCSTIPAVGSSREPTKGQSFTFFECDTHDFGGYQDLKLIGDLPDGWERYEGVTEEEIVLV